MRKAMRREKDEPITREDIREVLDQVSSSDIQEEYENKGVEKLYRYIDELISRHMKEIDDRYFELECSRRSFVNDTKKGYDVLSWSRGYKAGICKIIEIIKEASVFIDDGIDLEEIEAEKE